MRLLAQKVHQFVVAVRKLIHIGCYIAQLSFCSYFLEINRKYSKELFHQVVHRGDTGIQQHRNVFLQKIGVTHKNSTDTQIDHLCRNKFFCPAGFQGNNLEPRPNAYNMEWINLNLPFRGSSFKFWILKTVRD